MLPQSFRLPGRRHAYVDLQDVFEMYSMTGRFRDWVRRVVRPVLDSAVIQYVKEGADVREKHYAIAVQNARALIATLPEEKRATTAPARVAPAPAPARVAPAPQPAHRNHLRIRIPMHGFSNNKMYEPTSQGANRQLRRTADYNEWREVFASHVPGKPRWFAKNATCHIDIKFGHTAPHDTENLMKSALDTLFHTWRSTDNGVRSGSFNSEIVRGKAQGYIEIDVYQ